MDTDAGREPGGEVIDLARVPSDFVAQPPAPAPAPAADAGDDLTTELRRPAELKNQGVLTEEEFAAAKPKLLGM